MNKTLLFCLLFIGWHGQNIANAQGSGKKTYAVKNVTLIPMSRELSLPDQTVIIENGIIKTIADTKNTRIDKGITVIDGRGKYLMPGLFDMHAHFFYEQGEHKNTCETELKMMLANGITTARILAGHPAYLEAKEKVRHGNWYTARIFLLPVRN